MTLRRLLLTTISIFAFVAVSLAAALIDDQFADSNSQNHDLANNSLRIFNGRTATIRTDEAGAVTLDVSAVGTSSEAIWAFFTEAGSPVNLGVGDKLTVSLNFSMNGFAANGSDIRFGVLDSLGTRNTTNLTGGMNNSTFINDPGYALQFYPSGSGSPFGLYRRAILSGANVFNTMGDFTPITGSATGATTRQALADNVLYTLNYRISRESNTDTRISAEVTGGALSALKYSAVESSDAPQTSFDYFGFRFGGTNLATKIKFTRVLIDYTPAIPVITLQPEPENLLVQVGGEVSYVVTAEGRQLSYQWAKDGAPITGNASAKSSTLTLSNIQVTDAGSYACVVSNSTGSVTSNAAMLHVTVDPVPPPPVITSQPVNTTVVLGQPKALSVNASGDNLTYRWFKNNILISGAVSSTLTFPNATLNDAGVYKVIITNLSGSATSTPATLTVVSPMTISSYSPAGGASKQAPDTQLNLTFDRAPKVGNKGYIRIYSSDGSLYDTINLALSSQNKSIGGRTYNYRPIIISGNKAIITPHKQLIRNSSYYVLIDTGAITDEVGAPFVGISAVNQWAFSTRTNLTGEDQNVVIVAADNTGDFTTLQGAIDFVPAGNTSRKTILVRKGVYNEIVNVPSTKPFITIRGEDRSETIIQYDNNNNFNPAGTVYRAMFGVDASDFVLENITLHNTTSKGGSQAEAFRSSGAQTILNQVNLKSFQDTLLMSGKGYVANSYIEGDVDFMWGGGSIFFENCELKALNPGYYTQIRNSQGIVGNVYVNCKLTGVDGLSGIWLSRIDPNVFPYSHVVFINCAMGGHINPLGWLLNNATMAPNVQFWEYNSTDLNGALLDVSGRAAFSRQLTAEEAQQLSNPTIALTGWTPTALTAATSTVGVNQPVSVEWSAPSAHSQNDWIGFFKAGATDDDVIARQYIGSGSNGILTFITPLIAGEYEFRYFTDGATVSTIKSSSINVTGALYTLGSIPNTLNAGTRVVVDWTAPDKHDDKSDRSHMEYIGLYKGGDLTSPPIARKLIRCGDKGSEVFNLDELPELPSSYEFRIYVKERGPAADILAAVSNRFIVYPADQLLAFPGAEGAGAFASGGRGGDVYHVTNLNDSGEGSLRYGIQQATGPRTIVFDVSGNIMLKSRLKINKSNLTIAGQTAPGDGITVAGFGTNIGNAQNVIIRYLRFRVGDFNCPNIEDDAFWIDYSDNIMIDHVTASWSIDETLSVTDSNRITVQWSIIADSLNNSCHSKGAHGYGSLLGFGGGKYSFHHNLYANNNSRNPRVGSDVNLDFVNNVVVNWMGNSGYSGEADEGSPKINYIGNYVIAGPSTPANIRGRAFQGGSLNTSIYQANNLIDSNLNGTRDGKDTVWTIFHGIYTKLDVPIEVVPTSIELAKVAYQKVLESSGSSLATDSLDIKLFTDIQNDTGANIDSQNQVGGLPELESIPAPIDSDQDGMPDKWEFKNRLNPRNPADGSTVNRSGYTNLEEYLNQLLDDSDNPTHKKHRSKRKIKFHY